MANDMTAHDPVDVPVADTADRHAREGVSKSLTAWDILWQVIKGLASVKITVVLFAMAIFIVFAGTMAQWQLGLWRVVDTYFRAPFVWIEFQVFFPPSFFPPTQFPWARQVPGGFPFLGGWMIGVLLAINLLAAHLVRFKVSARGGRLVGGFVVFALGCLVTTAVIASGSSGEGFHYTHNFNWDLLWYVMLCLLALLWVATVLTAIVGAIGKSGGTGNAKLYFLGTCAVVIGALTAWLFYLQYQYPGDEGARLNDASMRILWQLGTATFASLVLLGGCGLLFGKRAGIVLLHGGIFLMMFGELLVGTSAIESRMTLREGETVDYLEHSRELELAITDSSNASFDETAVVPYSLLMKTEGVVRAKELPFDIEVVKSYENSDVQPIKDSDDNLATVGFGKFRVARKRPPEPGTSNRSDMASAYIRLLEKGGTKPIGIALVSQYLPEQKISIDGVDYQVALRAARTQTPFSMQLLDVREEKYLGTTIPMSYSSDLWLYDQESYTDQPVHIRMNNPLRYGGRTYYQSGYYFNQHTGLEQSTLQVVTNTGWMIPYVGCMIVATGMLFQFWVVLNRFLHRQAKSAFPENDVRRPQLPVKAELARSQATDPGANVGMRILALLIPALVVALCAGYLLMKARPPKAVPKQMNLYEFGKLPVMYEGRVKPFDSLARSSLLIISQKGSFVDDDEKKQPAVRWLLDVITTPDKADGHKVFRIENTQLLQALRLEERGGFRYAYNEFKDELPRFRGQVRKAREVQQANSDDSTVYQRSVLKLQTKLNEYELLKSGFTRLPLPPIPTRGEMGPEADRDQLLKRLTEIRSSLDRAAAEDLGATETTAPRAVPRLRPFGRKNTDDDAGYAGAADDEEAWIPFSTAWPRAYLQQQFDKMRQDEDMVPFEGFLMFFRDSTTLDYLRREYEREPDDSPALALGAIFDAYVEEDAAMFNDKVADYQAMLRKRPPLKYSASMMSTEGRFNVFQPFLYTAFLYIFALALACVGWLTWSLPGVNRIFNRTSTWLLLMVLVVHTGALIARIVISGRPPVTNLYSSAVFVGWGAVVLCLCFELFTRKGFGNAIAGLIGFGSLMVAYYLSLRGDTIEPMRAVLDTQFWLTTHVVIIALGYAATFVAGAIGALYIFLGLGTPIVSPGVSKILHRMIYGVLCFAIIFSFVGTVLGGLWADDSWGRFWGWDPKENGALIIVLWNALVLHARFGRLVGDRGLAVLAVAGNIVTAWSWFGTNELKVGLHSYGFTEGVVGALFAFAISQLVIMGLGCLPRFCWWSFRETDEEEPIVIAETV